MHHTLIPSPPRARLGLALVPALPVTLTGHDAALLTDADARPEERTRLRLDWDDGAVTDLTVSVTGVDEEVRLTRVRIDRVDGDWRRFLEYLGQSA